jgi:hypothetical protein
MAQSETVLLCRGEVIVSPKDGDPGRLPEWKYYKLGSNVFSIWDDNSVVWSRNMCELVHFSCSSGPTFYSVEGEMKSDGGGLSNTSIHIFRQPGTVIDRFSDPDIGSKFFSANCQIATDPAASTVPNKF